MTTSCPTTRQVTTSDLAHVHVLGHADDDAVAAGRVELAIEYPDPLDRELGLIIDGDDAAAVVDMARADAVALAFDLLTAADCDPLDVANHLLDAAARNRRQAR